MPVEALRADVAALAPVDDRARTSIRRFLDELDRLARPFDPLTDPTHVTASGIVVGARGVLLHRHKRLGLWLQPGGHLEPGETPSEAALRETVEETGIAARHPAEGPRLVHVDVHAGGRGHTHLDVRYLLHASTDDPAPPPGESQAVRWWGWEEAIAVADDGLVGALQALRERNGSFDV